MVLEYGDLVDDNKDDFIGWISPIFHELRRVSDTVFITGQARLPDYALIEKWKWLLCWYKPAAMGRSPVGFCNWEPIAMWGKGGGKKVDVLKAPIRPDKELSGRHPCPKPIAWATLQMQIFPNATRIIDPFMGSGTTAIAAKMLGLDYVGIDIEEKFCALTVERVERLQREYMQF